MLNSRTFIGLVVMAVVIVFGADLGAVGAQAASGSFDVSKLDMVPVSMGGVAGNDPDRTQTPTLDVLVWDFAQIGNRMYVGGGFLRVKNSEHGTEHSQPFLAAFDVNTGEWISTWRPTVDRAVYALDVSPGGALLVGGEFETVNGVRRPGLVALNPTTGSIDSTFGGYVTRDISSKRAMVRDIEVRGANTYVAGNFSEARRGSVAARVYKAARFVGNQGTVDTRWRPEVTGSGIWGIDVDEAMGEATIAGFFTAVNGRPDSESFHSVNLTNGESVGAKKPIPRNLRSFQPEYDVTYGNDILFAIGEQHSTQVLRSSDNAMIGYHTTGSVYDEFRWRDRFAGGGYQVGERIGSIVFAGCHCTYSERNGMISHYSSFSGRRTRNRLLMAYDATTGELVEGFKPDISSPKDGVWAVASDTNGCLYIGGDLHLGGFDAGTKRWLGGFGKLCPSRAPITAFGSAGSTLIGAGTRWSFDDSGSNRGQLWRYLNYDDSAWKSDYSGFGFGLDPVVSPWRAGSTTYYARKSFNHSGAIPRSLSVELMVDDGAVVYLNGTELVRDNMPTGTINAATDPPIWRGGEDATRWRTFIAPPGALRTGRNVVAVEVHNLKLGGTDALFNMRLSTSTSAPPAPSDLGETPPNWAYDGEAEG